jgi:hypothetical protein
LNLPKERHSHGLRRLAAIEATRGSYEEASSAIVRQSGVRVGKRQVEALAASSSVDFDAFYEAKEREAPEEDEVVVISGWPIATGVIETTVPYCRGKEHRL